MTIWACSCVNFLLLSLPSFSIFTFNYGFLGILYITVVVYCVLCKYPSMCVAFLPCIRYCVRIFLKFKIFKFIFLIVYVLESYTVITILQYHKDIIFYFFQTFTILHFFKFRFFIYLSHQISQDY